MVGFMSKTVILKISKGVSGSYRICSVPLRKLSDLSFEKHLKWKVEGDFLVLFSGEG
jgi:hypothetical protein